MTRSWMEVASCLYPCVCVASRADDVPGCQHARPSLARQRVTHPRHRCSFALARVDESHLYTHTPVQHSTPTPHPEALAMVACTSRFRHQHINTRSTRSSWQRFCEGMSMVTGGAAAEGRGQE